jgi:hypothetical protein
MQKLLAVLIAAIVGLGAGGGLGLLLGQAPVFHWEMAGLVVAVVAAGGGTIAAATGTLSGRVTVGAGVGAVLAGAVFLLLSLTAEHPAAVTLSGTAAAAAAAAFAGALGGAIGRDASRGLPGGA